MLLSSILDERLIFCNLKGQNCKAIYEEMFRMAARSVALPSSPGELAVLGAAEEMQGSILRGNGFYTPHLRSQSLSDIYILIGIPEKPRYLSSKETVSWVYQILINGATGAFWWGAHSGQQPIASFWKTARQLRKEIDILTPVFNTVDPVSDVTCNNENVTSVCRYLDGKYYLITTNLHKDPENAVYNLKGIKDIAKYKAKDLFGNRKITVKDGKLNLQYAPWERIVICFEK